MKKPNVVFTFVEAGFGHIMPAKAISDAFEKKYGDKCNVIKWKIFTESNNPKLVNYQNIVIKDAKLQSKYKTYAFLSYWISELIGGKASRAFLDFYFRKAKKDIMDEICEKNPDVIVNTYPSPSHYTIKANNERGLDSLVVSYSPDPAINHGYDPRSDMMITNNDQAAKMAEKRKFDKNKIVQVPFVLRQEAYDITETQSQMRQILNLPKDKFTIVLCDGGYGEKNLLSFTKQLLKLDKPITIVAVAGKNEKTYAELKKLDKNLSDKITYKPFGFLPDVCKYVRAADLFVGKSGANSLMESFYFGVPVIVSSYGNVLEKNNAKYFIKKLKYGEIIMNKYKFTKRIKQIIDNPSLLDVYKENLVVCSDNTGAEKAADAIYNLLMKKLESKNNK